MRSVCFARMLLLVLAPTVVCWSEARTVRVNFVVDGQPKPAPKAIDFYSSAGSPVARARIDNGTFFFPVESIRTPVTVVIRFQGRKMVFRDIHAAKFATAWTVGIDRPPFNAENPVVANAPTKPKEVWFIEFQPTGGDGTVATVLVPFRHTKRR